MREFLEEVFKYKKKFIPIKIGYSDKKKIQECTLELLELKDFGQLRDRYEGQMFYDRFTREMMSEIALEKLLDIKFIDWEAKRTIKGCPNVLIYNNLKVGVTANEFAEYPILIDEEITLPQVFTIKKGSDYIYICGLATTRILEENSKKIPLTPMALGRKAIFTGFDKLLMFDSTEKIEELLLY